MVGSLRPGPKIFPFSMPRNWRPGSITTAKGGGSGICTAGRRLAATGSALMRGRTVQPARLEFGERRARSRWLCHVSSWARAPPEVRGSEQETEKDLILADSVQERRSSVQAVSFVDQLLDIHRDRNALDNAARRCAGFGRLCDACRFSQSTVDFGKSDLDGLVDRRSVHVVPRSLNAVTLRLSQKSSESRDNLIAKIGLVGSRSARKVKVVDPRRPVVSCGLPLRQSQPRTNGRYVWPASLVPDQQQNHQTF